MSKITFSFVNGKSKTFHLSESDIQKILMAIENVQTIWFVVQGFKFRPEALVSIETE